MATEKEAVAKKLNPVIEALKKDGESPIVRHGNKIVLPDNPAITLREAVEVLNEEIAAEEQDIQIREEINGCLWDAAHATMAAMKEMFGYVHGKPIVGFFGTTPPQVYTIPSGVGQRVEVPWGDFTVPGIPGKFTTMARPDGKGHVAFGLQATTKKKYTAKIKELAELARKYQREKSLYKGKAIRVRFKDDNGELIPMLTPEFMDVVNAKEENLILSDRVANAVSTSIFTPIKYAEGRKKLGIPAKRGVLCSGMYGTGKTLTAYVAAHLCEQVGRTFVYVEKADELKDAVRFASQYQPSMIFCEDIDRVTSGSRDEDIDSILNIIDGIESKESDLMVILTTNNSQSINKAMIRPGRLDDVIEFTTPDAHAVERLVRHYGGTFLANDVDLTDVGRRLEGQIPAVIRECVERSKLSQLKLQNGYVGDHFHVTPAAILDAADSMAKQLELLTSKTDGYNVYEALGRLVGAAVRNEVRAFQFIEDRVIEVEATEENAA